MGALGDALSAQTLSDVGKYKALSSTENVTALIGIRVNLVDEIDTASSSVGGASYDGWNDKVGSKLSGHSNSLKDNIYPQMASDVSSNLDMLIDQIKVLNFECQNYERIYNQREGISVSSSLSEEQLDSNQRKRAKLATELESIVSEINSTLTNISNIKFMGDSSSMDVIYHMHDTSDIDDDDEQKGLPPDETTGGKKFYYFGFTGFYSDNPYILGGGYGVYDSAEDVGADSAYDQGSQYNQAEYQQAVDEHRDILMCDGAELEFDPGYLWGAIGRDYYNSNSCVTLWAYDASTGMYRSVSYQDADGTNHFSDGDRGRTVAEMRKATYK